MWEGINMDFIVGIPRTRAQHDSMWVIFDSLTKSKYFLPIKVAYSAEDYAKLYLKEKVRFLRSPLLFIWDRGTQFTTHFLKAFQYGIGTNMKLSTPLYPKTGGPAECTIRTLDDMLRACIKNFKGNWNDHLP